MQLYCTSLAYIIKSQSEIIMTAKIPKSIIDQAENLYISGMSLREVSESVGKSEDALRKHLKLRGVEMRKTSTGLKPKNTILDIPEDKICIDYAQGCSENLLSKQYGVSRNVIKRILRDNNIDRRNQSQSESLKWSQMSPKQREDQVKNCHIAIKGAARSDDTKHKIAISRQENTPDWYIGVGEREFKELLSLKLIDFEYQKPVLGYNLDFFIDGVAVELTSFTGRNSRVKKPQQVRALNIFNAELIHTLAVEIQTKEDIALFYNQIMSAVVDLQNQSKSHCNYWIARCNGNSFSLEKIIIKTL